jgi:hypothetical protein
MAACICCPWGECCTQLQDMQDKPQAGRSEGVVTGQHTDACADDEDVRGSSASAALGASAAHSCRDRKQETTKHADCCLKVL